MNGSLTVDDLTCQDEGVPGTHGERRYLCPFPACEDHRGAGHRSMSVNVATGLYLCHRCKAAGKLSGDVDERRPPSDQSHLAPRRPRTIPKKVSKPYVTLNADTQPLVENGAGTLYLDSRSIPFHVALSAGVRYSPDWFGAETVVFPMVDQTGHVVAAHGRATSGTQKKTLGSKSTALFSTPNALLCDSFVIVEGPCDALSFAACGFPAVALVGTAWPEWLAERGYNRLVAVATDSDEAGEHAASNLSSVLQQFGANAVRLRPSLKDWNEYLVMHGRHAMISAIAPVLFDGPLAVDPRGGDDEDSLIWRVMVSRIRQMHHANAVNLNEKLHHLRCLGASLVDAQQGKRISHGTMGADEYEQLRHHLTPHEPILRLLLRTL